MKIAIHDDCQTAFKDLKFNKSKEGNRYLVFKIEKEQIVFERAGKKEETWTEFIHSLPANEFRYTVFDISFTNHDGMNISKIFFCNWNPDAAPIKTRLLYATAKENFRVYLDLNGKEITLNSPDDYNEAAIIKEFDK